ncbi:expressed unknown protein [Seminavis robusta]|uniref:Uncharacterized protein n=1 Tax=Seminavis robusta TaxID=568900 RepID=A0A9N8EV53_9STRA|nr:expressed unknown protein [Seminavis robusta]|eukprot:Sro1853_g301810.1 n/a (215) ;mRNA; f:15419-16141
MLQTHFDTFLLAVASSTDNFLVGVSSGLSTPAPSTGEFLDNHFFRVNFVVALCNASGTLLATYLGDTLRTLPEILLKKLAAAVSTSSSPESYRINFSVPSFLAAVAFAFLAWKEFHDGDGKDEVDNKGTLPMTLNNLAGGVAAGVMGISILEATAYAFVVSLGSMSLGHSLATRVVSMQQQSTSPQGRRDASRWCRNIAVLVYVLLSLQSFMGV